MKRYLVGGAVRDQLLGLPVKDKDWVVVGATPDDMLAQGYRQVGAEFPVFLHPQTGEEHALARKERKVGPGYQGFICDFSPDVTLEEDLARRDFTINAMAKSDSGELIDPFDGEQDLAARQIKHVSPAFREDPLRVIRAARFAARFYAHGFDIAPSTLGLLKEMSASGELSSLSPQRVWQDLEKALATKNPSVFFLTLREVGALAPVLPEIDALFGVPQNMTTHPEIDTATHTLKALDRSVQITDRLDVRFAVLCHDLGKATTPTEDLPEHQGHEQRGLALIDRLCDRLRVSKRLHQMARLCCQWRRQCHQLNSLPPSTIMELLMAFRALQNSDQLVGFTLACRADFQGRAGYETAPYPQAEWLLAARAAAADIQAAPLQALGFSGPALGTELRRVRTQAIADVLATLPRSSD